MAPDAGFSCPSPPQHSVSFFWDNQQQFLICVSRDDHAHMYTHTHTHTCTLQTSMPVSVGAHTQLCRRFLLLATCVAQGLPSSTCGAASLFSLMGGAMSFHTRMPWHRGTIIYASSPQEWSCAYHKDKLTRKWETWIITRETNYKLKCNKYVTLSTHSASRLTLLSPWFWNYLLFKTEI